MIVTLYNTGHIASYDTEVLIGRAIASFLIKMKRNPMATFELDIIIDL